MTEENGELRKRSNDLEGKSLKAIAFAEQLQAHVSFVTEERDVLVAKRRKLALPMQCMASTHGEAKSLCARAAETNKASSARVPNVREKCRIANTEVIGEQTCSERPKQKDRNV